MTEAHTKIELSRISYALSTTLSLLSNTIGGAIIASAGHNAHVTTSTYGKLGMLLTGKVTIEVAYELANSIPHIAKGAALGLMAGAVDEVAIYNEWYAKHYAGLGGFWYNMAGPVLYITNLVPGINCIPTPVISLAAASIMAPLSDDFLDYKNRTYAAVDAFSSVMGMFDDHKLITEQEGLKIGYQLLHNPFEAWETIRTNAMLIAENPFLLNYAKITVCNLLGSAYRAASTIFLAQYTQNQVIVKLINNKSPAALNFGKDIVQQGAKILTLLAASEFVSNEIDNYVSKFEAAQDRIVEHKIMELLWEGDNDKKIKAANLNSTSHSEINQYVSHLYSEGMQSALGLMNSLNVNSAYMLNLQTYAPNLLLPYAVLDLIAHKVSNLFALKTQQMDKDRSKLEQKLWISKYVMISDSDLINRRGGKEYFQQENTGLENKIEASKNNGVWYRTGEKYISLALNRATEFGQTLYYGYHFINAGLDIASIPVINSAINNALIVVNYHSNYAASYALTIDYKHRLDKVLEAIAKPYEYTLHKSLAPQGGLVYENFTVNINERTIVHIPYLKLDLGGLYAFTGEKGCGKSSTFISTKDYLYGVLSSAGNIIYPEIGGHAPKIVFLTQTPYLLPSYMEPTLLETVYFPQNVPTDPVTLEALVTKIITMFGEFRIRGFDPQQYTQQQMRDYLLGSDFKFSGGETSLLTIVSAILEQPDILLLDESLQSLDPQSRINTLHLLKKYLPYALKIIIAHEDYISAAYTSHIHFTGGGIQQFSTPSSNFVDYDISLEAQPDQDAPTASNLLEV
jgi:ABC-type multidrug transport system ATPase subunit